MATTLSAPDPSDVTPPIVLDVQEAVEPIKEDAAQSMLPPVTDQRKLEIGQQAKGFTTDLMKFNPNSPEFTSKLNDINSLAQKEIVRSGSGTNRMLERSASSVSGSKKSGGDATQQVAGTLANLRSTVEDLTPNAASLTGAQKILGFIPGGNKLRKYFQRYESAQSQLNNIIKALLSGQDELRKDNASLQTEKTDLWSVMGDLNEYAVLAENLDTEITAQAAALRAAGNVAAANAFESDVLFAVRQRRQDILTQLAVSVQGYMAMTLVQKNNEELIKGVERARTTTITALRTAVIVAQALDNQRLVLDQIDAVNTATNNTIAATSQMLRQQTGRIQEQAVNSGVSVATLTKAFDDIFATLDEVENFKVKASANLATTIDGLTVQLERAKPQLDRARQLEAASNNTAISK